MLKLDLSNKFKKDYKLLKKQNRDFSEFERVIEYLIEEQPLPQKYKEHSLKGKYIGYKECHIFPDWLLIYRIIEDRLILRLERTGSHSDTCLHNIDRELA